MTASDWPEGMIYQREENSTEVIQNMGRYPPPIFKVLKFKVFKWGV